ncbi:MAG: hypothetical protein NZ960_04240 [Candidatus Kapabacteria bacterium]|nr:hypothetical protein [Candidatus Kapabacteria bacterium]MDW8012137.1 hypothetical protein [Bacteroidota bacterium]
MAHADIRDSTSQLSERARELLSTRGRLSALTSTLRLSIYGDPQEGLPQNGWGKGIAIWWRAVVVPFYSHWISSAVYAGAALLLFLVGLRRFADAVSTELLIVGFAAEAVLLLLLALASLAAPVEAPQSPKELQALTGHIEGMASHVADIAEILSHSRGQTATLEQGVAQLTRSVGELVQLLRQTTQELQQWRTQELRSLVRQELEQLLSDAVREKLSRGGRDTAE